MLSRWHFSDIIKQRGLVTSSLACIDSKVTKHTTVKWPIVILLCSKLSDNKTNHLTSE